MSKIPAGFESRGTVYNVRPTNVIVVDGWNPRIDFGAQEELEASIEANGVRMPITVRRGEEGGLELVDGERRLRACLALHARGVEVTLPATMESKGTTAEDRLVHALVANQGKPFNPVEEAIAFKRLRDAKWTNKRIADSVGKGELWVADRLKLIDANEELRAAVEKGEVPIGLATEILNETKGDAEAQAELTKEAKSGKAGRKKVAAKVTKKKEERKAQRAAQGKKQPGAKKKTVATPAEIQAELSKTIADLQSLCQEAGLPDEAAVRAHEQADDKSYLSYLHGVAVGLQTALGRKNEKLF